MEPITEILCIIPQILEFVLWGISMLIFGAINAVSGFIWINCLWSCPIFILSGVALILHNLVSILLFPLYSMFPFLYIMPNMCLSFLNNASIAGLLPSVGLIATMVLAIIVAIPNAILHIILILGCNSNGISLCSKLSQTILSWVSA